MVKKKVAKKKVSKKKVSKKKVASKQARRKKTAKKKVTKKQATSKKVGKKKTAKKAGKKKASQKKAVKGRKPKAGKKKTSKKTAKKAIKKTTEKGAAQKAFSQRSSRSQRLSRQEAIEKYRKTPLVSNVEPIDEGDELENEEETSLLTPESLEEEECPPQVGLLSDEYNVDDEPADGEDYGYGWGYEDALDDPESLSERSGEIDEDDAYAHGQDRD